MEKTAIDWLIDQLEKYELYSKISFQCLKEIEEAKEMHKQEIIDAYLNGRYEADKIVMSERFYTEQYYNETFGGKDEQ
jgi:hypothetical protein